MEGPHAQPKCTTANSGVYQGDTQKTDNGSEAGNLKDDTRGIDHGDAWASLLKTVQLLVEALQYQTDKMDLQLSLLNTLAVYVVAIAGKLGNLNMSLQGIQDFTLTKHRTCGCSPIVDKLATLPSMLTDLCAQVKKASINAYTQPTKGQTPLGQWEDTAIYQHVPANEEETPTPTKESEINIENDNSKQMTSISSLSQTLEQVEVNNGEPKLNAKQRRAQKRKGRNQKQSLKRNGFLQHFGATLVQEGIKQQSVGAEPVQEGITQQNVPTLEATNIKSPANTPGGSQNPPSRKQEISALEYAREVEGADPSQFHLNGNLTVNQNKLVTEGKKVMRTETTEVNPDSRHLDNRRASTTNDNTVVERNINQGNLDIPFSGHMANMEGENLRNSQLLPKDTTALQITAKNSVTSREYNQTSQVPKRQGSIECGPERDQNARLGPIDGNQMAVGCPQNEASWPSVRNQNDFFNRAGARETNATWLIPEYISKGRHDVLNRGNILRLFSHIPSLADIKKRQNWSQ